MPVAGPSKRTKGKQPQRARKFADHDESDESDEKGPEIDFEVMDITSQDDKLSDKEAWDCFNKRFLDDDIFPPSDSVGLHKQYGFNPEVKFYYHNACLPFLGVESEDVHLLIQLLLIWVVAWLCMKSMAPFVFAHWRAMSYILHEAVHLYAMTECFIDAREFLSSEFTAKDLRNQVKRMKIKLFELSTICLELRDWHDLSSKFMDHLHGNWLIQRIPMLGGIIEIVDGILPWIDAAYELDIPYQAPKEGMNYLFSCPTSSKEPKGLQDSLAAAQMMDPSWDVMEEVFKTFDEILSRLTNMPSTPKLASTSGSTSAATTNAPQPIQSPPTGEPSPEVELAPDPVVSLTPEDAAQSQGERGKDADAPAMATCIPSIVILTLTMPLPLPLNLPESKGKLRVRPKMKSLPLLPSLNVEPGPVINPALSIESTPIPPVEETRPNYSVTSALENMIEGVQSMDLDPQEAGAETAGPSPAMWDAPPPTAPEPKSKSNGKAKSKAIHPSSSASASPPLPPPTPPVVPETRQACKWKLAPETKTETENGQEKHTSACLKAKSGLMKVNMHAKEGKSVWGVAAWSSHKK
ncbi:hypothetical protein FRC11_009068 [Ceratobasidium sp. 423]|nr:hypothetical protein FRC11_009068 [Ceratobasidium sp. 423]